MLGRKYQAFRLQTTTVKTATPGRRRVMSQHDAVAAKITLHRDGKFDKVPHLAVAHPARCRSEGWSRSAECVIVPSSLVEDSKRIYRVTCSALRLGHA